jgi:hypothetical protein
LGILPKQFASLAISITPKSLGARHGIYRKSENRIFLNPKNFNSPAHLKGIAYWKFTIVHEVGHSVYREYLSKAQRQAWRDLSGWTKKKGDGQSKPYTEKRKGWPEYIAKETHRKDAQFADKYASKNSHEDFAESFAFCVLGKANIVPKSKANYISGIMNGK